jgi:hypothetical protein
MPFKCVCGEDVPYMGKGEETVCDACGWVWDDGESFLGPDIVKAWLEASSPFEGFLELRKPEKSEP